MISGSELTPKNVRIVQILLIATILSCVACNLMLFLLNILTPDQSYIIAGTVLSVIHLLLLSGLFGATWHFTKSCQEPEEDVVLDKDYEAIFGHPPTHTQYFS